MLLLYHGPDPEFCDRRALRASCAPSVSGSIVNRFRFAAHWPLRAMTLRNVSDPKKVWFATRRRASALKLSTPGRSRQRVP
jgi:hypothetical protein